MPPRAMIRGMLAGLVLIAAVLFARELLRPRLVLFDEADGPPLPPLMEPEVAAALGRAVRS